MLVVHRKVKACTHSTCFTLPRKFHASRKTAMSHLESLPLYIAALYIKPLEQFHSFKDFGL
jgi:hypothetical protein